MRTRSVNTADDLQPLDRILDELLNLEPFTYDALHVLAHRALEAARSRRDAQQQAEIHARHEAEVQQLLHDVAWRLAVKNPAVFELGRRGKKGGRS